MIKLTIKKENLMLFGSSFIIAIFLWLQVHTQIDPMSKEGFALMLHLKNLPSDRVITKKNDRIGIIVEGPISLLKTFTLDSVEAYLDLSQATIGTKEYPVKFNLKELHGLAVHLKRPKETLTIEKLVRRVMPVTIQEKGVPPNEVLFDGASSKPQVVTLIGASSSIKKVCTIQATLDLGMLSINSTYLSNLQPLDQGGQLITDIKSDPETVLIKASVISAPIIKKVPINVVWKGTLPFGYRLKSFTINPNQIVINGNNTLINQVSSIETLPVNLSEIIKSTIVKIGLKSIPDISIQDPNIIEVNLNIELSSP